MKKKSLVLIIICVMTVLAGCQGNHKQDNISENSQKFPNTRFFKEETVIEIIDQEEIKEILNEFPFTQKKEIEKLIYVPLEESVEAADAKRNGGKYSVKQLGFTESVKELVFSSWYEAPGGEARIDDTFAVENDFKNVKKITGGEEKLLEILCESYLISVTNLSPKEKQFPIEVQEGYKRNMEAYLYEIAYSYEIWKDGIFKDSKVGAGELRQPKGIVVVIGAEEKTSPAF